jgi:putative oxidoreductase
VPASGVMAVGGGLLVALGLWGDLGALLLAAFVIRWPSGCTRFWRLADPMQRANQQVHCMKNVSLGSAALAFFALFQQFGSEL